MIKNLLFVYSATSLLVIGIFGLGLYYIDITQLSKTIILLISVSFGLIPYMITIFWTDNIVDFFKFKKINATNFFEYYETIPINIIYEISEKKYLELSRRFEEKAFNLTDGNYAEVQCYYSSISVPQSVDYNNIPFGFRNRRKKDAVQLFCFSKMRCTKLIPFKTIVESLIETKNGFFYVKYCVGEHPFKYHKP